MDASPSPSHLEPDDSPPGTRTYITDPLIGDPETVIGRFRCEGPSGWTASGTLGYSKSIGVHISHLEVQPVPGEAVTSSLLRQVPTGAVLAAFYAGRPAVETPESLTEARDPRRPGRAPLSDELLSAISLAYLEETAPGKPRGAIGRLAERFGKPKPTISRWIMRAREDGWLTPTAPGREGGEAGPTLRGSLEHRTEARPGFDIDVVTEVHAAPPEE